MHKSDINSCRILESSRRRPILEEQDECDLEDVPNKTNAKFIEHEYDSLPAIDELRIHVEEDIPLELFGKIVNIVDRLGISETWLL